MIQYIKLLRTVILIFTVLIVFFSICFSAQRKFSGEFPDVFVHKNTVIPSEQEIGKLMVAFSGASDILQILS